MSQSQKQPVTSVIVAQAMADAENAGSRLPTLFLLQTFNTNGPKKKRLASHFNAKEGGGGAAKQG